MPSDSVVPSVPELSRRRVLAGIGGAVGLGTLGSIAVGATAPTALPDVLTDEATKHYPTPPEVASHWRPTVTESHARDVVDHLATVVSRTDSLWPKVETDRHNTGAGGWLEDARAEVENENYHEALFNARYGLQFAAEQLGFARAKLDREDVPALAERALAIRDQGSRILDALEPYRVVDPGLDLAHYLHVEMEVLAAEMRGGWSEAEAAANGVDDEDGPPEGDLDPNAVGQITRGVHLGEVHLATADHYWTHLQERLGDDATAFSEHLQTVADDYRTRLDDRPTRETVKERLGVADVDDYGPYEYATVRLVDRCLDPSVPSPWTTDVDGAMRATTTLGLAKGLAMWRALDLALDELVVDETDTGFDSGHVLAEKRRARDTYQDVIGDDPDPLLAHQAGRAIEDLQVAVVGFADSYRHPLWKERLDAYCYALVGRAKLEHHPTYYQPIIDGP